MNLKEFEKLKDSIWAKWEEEYGSPIAQAIRDRIEKEIVRLTKDEPETLDDLDVYLGQHIPIWKSLVSQSGTSPAKELTKAKPQKRYRKCFERRFNLVNFVLDRLYKRGTLIDWKRIVTELNEANPYHPMSLSTLRVEYQRAIKEHTLMLQVYISRSNRFPNSLWQPLDKQLRNMAHNQPFSYVMASLIGQKMWADQQPLILSLSESIKKSPMFKEIEAQDPETAAIIHSKLEELTNMGEIRPAVKDTGDIEFSKHRRSDK